MKGGVWELVRGVDFSRGPMTFRCYCFQKATEAGLKVRTSVRGDVVTIEFLTKDGCPLVCNQPECKRVEPQQFTRLNPIEIPQTWPASNCHRSTAECSQLILSYVDGL